MTGYLDTTSALLSAVGMLEFHRLNLENQQKCDKEGITKDRMEEFREMGDKSPLYQCVISRTCFMHDSY